jgi:chromosome partitioning protein
MACMGSIALAMGQKGGSGKSFFVRHLAVEWTLRGFRVVVLDADPQKTCVTWAGLAAQNHKLSPPVFEVDEANLIELATYWFERSDIVLIDTQGAINANISAAVEIANVVLLPANANRVEDIWAMGGTEDVVRAAMAPDTRPDLIARICVTEMRGTKLNKAAAKALSKRSVPVAKTVLRSQNEYAVATTMGMGVTTYAPKSNAANQFREFTDEIQALLAPEKGVAANGK